VIKEPRRIEFDEFARHLRAVFDELWQAKEPILVEREGQVYRLELEAAPPFGGIWAGYNAEQVRQALDQSAGALTEVDREALLRDLREQRAQSSDGRPA
jgi:hypothetical protein